MTPDELRIAWEESWEPALACWSKFTKLHPPILCESSARARGEGLTGSMAMIRLIDHAVVIDLQQVAARGIGDYSLEILAHEIGHHILAPSNLTDHARALARIRRGLPTLEEHAPLVANLYYDLLINDRLQRHKELRLADVYRKLLADEPSPLWLMYQRTYEILWGLPFGTLARGEITDDIKSDAMIASRLVRVYAVDWVAGAGRYAALCLPYLAEAAKESEKQLEEILGSLRDTALAGKGGNPDGMSAVEASEEADARDPRRGFDAEGRAPGKEVGKHRPSKGQAREPFKYRELLQASGITITKEEAAVRYYRERAMPHLIPYPVITVPESQDPLPEGLEIWDLSDPVDEAAWLESVMQSGVLIPSQTIYRRVYGTSPGMEPEKRPLDLDLYIDCSGSMPDPRELVSYLTLAGAIIALSALRAGASVQAVLWSGKHEVLKTDGFVRNEREILKVITGFFGGGTQFPLPTLRETHKKKRNDGGKTHILVISDEGIDTMFTPDEFNLDGWVLVRNALENAGGGGTMALNIHKSALESKLFRRAREELGWKIHPVSSWDELVDFAKAFSRETYAGAAGGITIGSSPRTP